MTPAQNITRHFRGDWQGNQGAFPTPGHSAADRGTTVKDVPGGDVVFHCHNDAGFDWRGMKDECRRLGLLPDHVRANDNCRTDRTLRARDIDNWEYTDADGTVLYRKVRTALPNGGKSYRFEHPDGRGGWLPKRGDADQVPYRLPDILAAEHAAVLYMAEGEKQADKLVSWGFLATSSKDWRSFDFAGYVKGRTVVILPDNDDEGVRIAEAARKAVETAGGRAVILTLPDLPPKGDIMDWRGTADDLRALTDTVLSPPAKLLPFIDAADLAGVPTKPRQFMVEGMEPRGSATYLTGVGASGKSLMTQQRMTCSAAGLPFLGMATRQGVSIYISCEDDLDELHRRQESINAALGVTWEHLRGKLILVSLKGQLNNEFCTFDADNRMRTTARWDETVATIRHIGATHVGLDNVAHLFTGNENVRNHVAAFCNLLDRLAQEINGSVLFLGHPNKAGDEFSGSTAWENQVRSRIYLALDKGDDGVVGNPDARVLTNSKPNYSRRGEAVTFRWHQWAFVRDCDLSEDRRRELDEVIRANADDVAFLACLSERMRQEQAVSEKTSSTYAPKVFERMPESKRIGKLRLEAAMERLIRTGRIERAMLPWKRDRKDVFGLRPTCANGCADAAPTRCADAPDAEAQTVPNTHPISKDIPGAAPEGSAAPSHEEGRREDLSRVIFAEPDPADDLAGGWS